MGFFSGYHSKAALDGLGRIVNKKTGSLSKDARRVVSAFMRGEVAEGSCGRLASGEGCGIVSEGNRLLVQSPDSDKANLHVLAKREGDGSTMEVCIPAKLGVEFVGGGDGKPAKKVQDERSRDIRSAAGALLTAVGAGVGVRSDVSDETNYFSGSKGRSRIAVPGSCVRVKFDKRQRELAAMTLEAKEKKFASVVMPTEKQYASARAELVKAKREAAEAKRLLALEEAARERPFKMAQKAIEAAEKASKAAEERLFAAREKASALELARTMRSNVPVFIPNPAFGPLPTSKVGKKPRKKSGKKAAAKKPAAKKPAAKKGKGGKKGKK